MARLSVAASLLAMSQAALLPFDSFLEVHERSYQQGSTEYQDRKALYEKCLAAAEIHNSAPNKLWTAGVNKLWDWTDSELQTLRGWDGSMRPEGGSSHAVRKHSSFLQQDSELPKEKIWSDLA